MRLRDARPVRRGADGKVLPASDRKSNSPAAYPTTPKGALLAMFVPVVERNQQPLMPTTPARARRWVKTGKATPFWKGGVWCVRLNQEPSALKTQPIVVGIDPGSKKE